MKRLEKACHLFEEQYVFNAMLPWGFKKIIYEFLKPYSRLLFLCGSDIEFLLSLRHSPELTNAITKRQNDLETVKRLTPSGILVKHIGKDYFLPESDSSFDLVITQHPGYKYSEIYRVLKPGGFFISQQVGGEEATPLLPDRYPEVRGVGPDFNLENEVVNLTSTGFRIMFRNQLYDQMCFTNENELESYLDKFVCYQGEQSSLANIIRWKLSAELLTKGKLTATMHRFVFVAKKC